MTEYEALRQVIRDELDLAEWELHRKMDEIREVGDDPGEFEALKSEKAVLKARYNAIELLFERMDDGVAYYMSLGDRQKESPDLHHGQDEDGGQA